MEYIAIFVLLMGSAFFSGTEIAYTSLNKLRMKDDTENMSATDRMVKYIYRHFDSALSTVLIGNNLVNIGANYMKYFKVGSKPVGANIFFNLNNLFDEWYIERGKDGADHTLETFTGYWGQGRNCSFGVRFTL